MERRLYLSARRLEVDIHHLEFPRPREPLVKALGDQHQSLPVLILAAHRKVRDKELEPSHVEWKVVFYRMKAAYATTCRHNMIYRKRANSPSERV